MRIGLLAPITHPLPPPGYGPWERVVADLAEGLTDRGHQVVVFAAAGSKVAGRLVATVPHPIAEWPADAEYPGEARIWEEIHIAEMAAEVRRGGIDVVHTHLSVHPLGFADLLPAPMVVTLHGVAWNRATHPALARHRRLPYVSISDAERRLMPELNYVATVYNGVRAEDYPVGRGRGGYLLFAGRIAPEKAPHLAIEAAQRSGLPLRLAGPVEDRYRVYYAEEIEPRLGTDRVEYLGAVTRGELSSLYRDAAALVVPLAWEEPFGLVVAEAMMSGTPVIGWRRGALPELVDNGVTGFLVGDVAEAARAVGRIGELSRVACRAEAESRFSTDRMAAGYEEAYRRALALTPG